MSLIRYFCKICGAALKESEVGLWKCEYCQNVYRDESVKKEAEDIVRKMLDEQKIETVNNLRKNLYDVLNEEYTDSFEICRICSEIKKYLPDDFAANFYYTANHATPKEVAAAIGGIDEKENYEYIHGIVKFILKSICSIYILPLQNLVERAYKETDGKMFEELSTVISVEAKKVSAGIYDSAIPRDVFIAHSSKDMKEVERLVEELESNGSSCFVAARNLKHGRGAVHNYEAEIKKAIDSCKCVVFISSKNSRTFECDALRIELMYIKERDVLGSPPEYKYNYETLPQKYRKPRIEYRIDHMVSQQRAEIFTKEFFAGLEYAYSPREVINRIDKFNHPVIEEKKTKFCASCGSEVPEAYNGCPKCGGNSFVKTFADYLEVKKRDNQKDRREKEAEELRKAKKHSAEQRQKEKLAEIESKNRIRKAAAEQRENRRLQKLNAANALAKKKAEQQRKAQEEKNARLRRKAEEKERARNAREMQRYRRSMAISNFFGGIGKGIWLLIKGIGYVIASPFILLVKGLVYIGTAVSLLVTGYLLLTIPLQGNIYFDAVRITFMDLFSFGAFGYGWVCAPVLIAIFAFLSTRGIRCIKRDYKRFNESWQPYAAIGVTALCAVLIFFSVSNTLKGETNLLYDDGNMLCFAEYDDGYMLVKTNLKKNASALDIPSEFRGKDVVALGEYVLYCDSTNANKIIIPETMKDIYFSTSLSSFSCSITQIHIPGANLWAEMNIEYTNMWEKNPLRHTDLYLNGEPLTEVVFEEGLEKINPNAFYKNRTITSVHLPASLVTIGENAFYECEKLTYVSAADPEGWITNDAVLGIVTGKKEISLSDPYEASKLIKSIYEITKKK